MDLEQLEIGTGSDNPQINLVTLVFMLCYCLKKYATRNVRY
jgi:hypothetical protein